MYCFSSLVILLSLFSSFVRYFFLYGVRSLVRYFVMFVCYVLCVIY